MGAPDELVTRLADKFQINTFIETGTYYGETAVWAARVFGKVLTIERSAELYHQAVEAHKNIENIQFILGDSKIELSKIITELSSPSLFWLDAHWSGGLTYGEEDQCPLIEEIRIINSSEYDHFILIDDARLFTSPPQPPHIIDQWPSIDKVIDILKEKAQDKYIVIIEDVIIAVPSLAKNILASYCQEVNDKAWKEYGEHQKIKRMSKLKQGFMLISEYFGEKFSRLSKKFSRLAN